MPAARYWRAVGIEAYGGGNLELSAFHLYDDQQVRRDATATLTSTVAPVSGLLSNLQDDDTASVVSFDPHPAGFALQWDFGLDGAVAISTARLGSAQSIDRFLSHFALQYSTTGANWTTLANLGRFAWPGSNSMTTLAAGDPYYSSVVLMLHGDGTSGTKVVVDDSPTPKPLTCKGTAQVSSAQSKFGGASLKLGGAVGDGIDTPYHPDFDLGTADFAIEFDLWLASWGKAGIFGLYYTQIVGCQEQSLVNGWAVWLKGTSTGRAAVEMRIAGINSEFSYSFGLNTWYHIEVSRASGTVRCFVNGALVGSASNAGSGNGTRKLSIGYHQDDQRGDTFVLDGFLEELRITRGLARNTSAYTPPPASYPGGLVGVFEAIPVSARTIPAPERLLPAVDLPPTTAHGHLREFPFFDVFNGGLGLIIGTVKEKSLPANVPLARKVWLMDEASGMVVRETWSDATTGAYEFRGVKQGVKYTVLAYDYTHTYRAVVADNLETT